MTLSQQIQDTLAAVDFTSICKPILEQQEQMKKICEDMFVSESIEQIKVVMQQSERVVNIASKVLTSISSVINLIDGDNVDNIISSLEIPKFKNALYDSLEEISPDTEISIESLTDSITDYYEIETEQEEETLSGIQKASHKKAVYRRKRIYYCINFVNSYLLPDCLVYLLGIQYQTYISK